MIRLDAVVVAQLELNCLMESEELVEVLLVEHLRFVVVRLKLKVELVPS